MAPAPCADAVIGLDAPDDAAALHPPNGKLLLQTVDFFRAFIDDTHLFGRIAATHALGDVYAMGGLPRSALAIACLPPAAEKIVEEDLYQMLRGGADVLEAAGAALIGGHSAEGAEAAIGFAVTGEVEPDRLMRKGALRVGDRLILTKPLGTGALFAAEMRGKARARWIEAAIRSMLLPAGPAAQCLAAQGATGCTDVTGFGLLGHLIEMLSLAKLDATLSLAAIPALDGALDALDAGLHSTLHPANARFARHIEGTDARLPLLYDPQTAGGLLAGVPVEHAAACLLALTELGYHAVAVIGVVEARAGTETRIRLGR